MPPVFGYTQAVNVATATIGDTVTLSYQVLSGYADPTITISVAQTGAAGTFSATTVTINKVSPTTVTFADTPVTGGGTAQFTSMDTINDALPNPARVETVFSIVYNDNAITKMAVQAKAPDAPSYAEFAAPKLAIRSSATDAPSYSDTGRARLAVKTFELDSVTMTDAALAKIGVKAVAIDALTTVSNFADNAMARMAIRANSADSVSNSDSGTARFAIRDSALDGTGFSDRATAKIGVKSFAADSVTATDAGSVRVALKVSAQDILTTSTSFADNAMARLAIRVSSTESVTMGDRATAKIAIKAFQIDSLVPRVFPPVLSSLVGNSVFPVRSPFLPPFALVSYTGNTGVYLYDENTKKSLAGMVYKPHSVSLPNNGVFRPERVVVYGSGSLTAAMVTVAYDGQNDRVATLDTTTAQSLRGTYPSALLVYNIPDRTVCREMDVTFNLTGTNVIIRHMDIEYSEVE